MKIVWRSDSGPINGDPVDSRVWSDMDKLCSTGSSTESVRYSLLVNPKFLPSVLSQNSVAEHDTGQREFWLWLLLASTYWLKFRPKFFATLLTLLTLYGKFLL